MAPPVERYGLNDVTPSKIQDRKANRPKAWWQRAIAGEQLPNTVFRHPKCEGTIEDYRNIALDARELTRKLIFEHPAGSAFQLNLRFPWLRIMRLNSASLDLELVTGRTVTVPLIWASCGVIGERLRLGCPLCGRRVCALYYVEPMLACRHCNGLWYAAQRTRSTTRRFLTKRRIRRKLGDYGQIPSARLPPRPRGMWRRTYARHCAALDRIERKLGY
jgi:hypothetical protein